MKISTVCTIFSMALLGIVSSMDAQATTVVLGGNVGGQTWTASGSPFIIQGDIGVQSGQTLTLLPGTAVQVAAFDGLASGSDPSRVEIHVSGSMIIDATTDSPVQLRPEAGTAPDSWGGIRVESGGLFQATPSTQINGNVVLTSGSSFSGYGIALDGNLTVGGSFIGGLPGSAVPLGSTFTIFDLTPGRTVTGTFNGLPEGAQVAIGANLFSITYRGGSGNDVLAQAVPEPTTAAMTAIGIGLLVLASQRRKRHQPN